MGSTTPDIGGQPAGGGSAKEATRLSEWAPLSKSEDPIELEPELHEGDGPIPSWIWFVVLVIIVATVFFGPFQLWWP